MSDDFILGICTGAGIMAGAFIIFLAVKWAFDHELSLSWK